MGLEGHFSAAEQSYGQSEDWQKHVRTYPLFAQLHHPYVELANSQGNILLTSLLPVRPPFLTQFDLEQYATYAEGIMTPGGSIVFDMEYGSNWLGFIKEQAPESIKHSLSAIPAALWEKRVLEYVYGTMPTLGKALKVPYAPRNEAATGFALTDLIDRAAHIQTFLIAKTLGNLEAVKPHIKALQNGRIIYHEVLPAPPNL